MQNNIWIYLSLMALVTYLVRVLPLTLIKGEIKNKFIRSFLFYVPYVTLAVMNATNSHWSGLIALVVGIALALKGAGLFTVSVLACVVVFIAEFFIK